MIKWSTCQGDMKIPTCLNIIASIPDGQKFSKDVNDMKNRMKKFELVDVY